MSYKTGHGYAQDKKKKAVSPFRTSPYLANVTETMKQLIFSEEISQ